jgi:invasion protein IalB
MKSLRISLALAAALFVAPAIAQEAAPQAAKANQPTDVKEIGDWTVRCFPGKSPTPCHMLELRVAKKSGQRVLGVLLAYAPANNATLLQVSVPLGVSLQNGLIINSDTWKSPPLKFRRCDQGGCYIESAVGDDVINELAKASNAKMQIVSVDGKRFDLAFSLKGFTEARSAMVELAKQKAGKGGAEATPAPAQ